MTNRQLVRQIGTALLSIAGIILVLLVLILAIAAVTLFTGLPELKLSRQRTSGPPATLPPTYTPARLPSPTIPIPVEGEQRLKTGEQSTWQFTILGDGSPVSLSLEARLDFDKLAGATPSLEVLVNGEPVMAPRLANKALDFDFADGRTYTYFHPPSAQQPYNLWMIFYSPDFSGNDHPGSGYQVLTGEAYRFVFDITPLVLPGRTNRLSIANHSELAAQKLDRPLWLVVRNIEVSAETGENVLTPAP